MSIVHQTYEDFEANVLHVAGYTKGLLSDGEAHYWAEVIEFTMGLTQGHRQSASRIAWKAITSYVSPHTPLLWGGVPGSKWVAIYDAEQIVIRSACPVCAADAGDPCMKMNSRGRTSVPKSYPHEERQVAAYEPATDAEVVALPT